MYWVSKICDWGGGRKGVFNDLITGWGRVHVRIVLKISIS